jgi:outer membrane protein OmpA-like peptidoglycan-associated protein
MDLTPRLVRLALLTLATNACVGDAPTTRDATQALERFDDEVRLHFPSVSLEAGDRSGDLTATARGFESAALVGARRAPTTHTGGGELETVADTLAAPHGRVGARLATRFPSGVRVSLGDSQDLAISFTPEGAADVAGDAAGSRVLYENAWPATDVLYQVSGDQVKELLLVRVGGPRRFSFAASVGAGLSVRPGAGGAIDLVDGEGEARLAVARPWAVDATGRRVDLDWTIEGSRWSLAVPAELQAPILVDPTIGKVMWNDRTPAGTVGTVRPEGRRFHSMAFDTTRNRAVLFGGWDGTTVYGDTWEWNPATRTWTEFMPASPPSARAGQAMAFNTACNCVLMNGGDTVGSGVGTNYVGDTWSWTVSGSVGTWTSRQAGGVGSAGRRRGHSMVWTPNGTVVFGGEDEAGAHPTTTMVWDNTNSEWDNVTNNSAQFSGRTNQAAGWDGTQLVVFGGIDLAPATDAALGDTLLGTYNGTNSQWSWATAVLATTPPSARESYLSSYAPAGYTGWPKLIMFGGDTDITATLALQQDTWEWTGTTWNAVTISGGFSIPAARRGHKMVYDPTRRVILLVGGQTGTSTHADTIHEFRINSKPDFAALADQNATEGVLLSFGVSATDPDPSEAVTLASGFVITPTPPGTQPTFTGGTGTPTAAGTFSWTPSFTAAGTYQVTFTATDTANTDSATDQVQITVGDANAPPVFSAITPPGFVENTSNNFTVTASDATDGDTVVLTLDSITPTPTSTPTFTTVTTGSSTTGTFTWNPGFTDSGSYTVVFRANDSKTNGNITTNVALTVTNTNRAPAVTAQATASGSEGTALNFNVTASDPDGQTVTLTLLSFTPTPVVAPAFTTTGTTSVTGSFAWTPGFTDAGTYTATFRGTDGTTPTNAVTTITISNTNRAPVVTVNPAGNKTVNENVNVAFTVSAVDPDGSSITLSASGLPTGATFAGASGTTPSAGFSWTPTFSQAGTHNISFNATDGTDTGTAPITITVTDVNSPPVIATITVPAFTENSNGSFSVNASDTTDNDAVTLTFDSITPTPSVAPTFTAAMPAASVAGLFSWTPGFTDSGTYSVVFRANDMRTGGSITRSVSVTVANSNRAPTVTAPATASGSEGSQLTFNVTASDPDGQTVTLTQFSITPTPTVAPTFTTTGTTSVTGTFTWTPGFTDSGTYTVVFRGTDGTTPTNASTTITINNTNRAPVITLNPVGASKTVAENANLLFTVAASDPDGQTVTLDTLAAVPTGANFPGATGTTPSSQFSWTPDFTQSAGSPYTVTFTASDGTVTTQSVVTITVTNTNRIPVFTAVTDKTVAEAGTLTFQVTATDPDGDTITYSAPTVPAGASFNAGNRTFTWVPPCTAADTGGGVYTATFNATDGTLTGTTTVNITVTGDVFVITPTTAFPDMAINQTSPPQQVIFTNTGTSTISVSAVTTSVNVFTVTNPPGSTVILANGDTLPINVTFRPTTATSFAGNLNFTLGNAACPGTTPLSGRGQIGDMSVTHSEIDFGEVRVNTTSAATTVTITNTGDAKFNVSSVSLTTGSGNFTLTDTTTYPNELVADESMSFDVAATPGSLGLLGGSITVATSLPDAASFVIDLDLTGVAPGMSLSASSIDFGPADLQGTLPLDRTLTITNDGTDTLSLTAAALVPDNGPFTIASTVGFPITILEGESADIPLSYEPTLESSGDQAELNLVSDALGETLITVPLAGRGVDRHIEVSPTTMTFPNTLRGSAAGNELTFTIRNTGGAALLLGGGLTPALALTGDTAFQIITDPIPSQVAPGATTTVTVRFSPPSAGAFAAAITVNNDDDQDGMVRIDMTGNGILAPLLVAPATFEAPVVPVGIVRPLTESLRIGNTSDSDTFHITTACIALAGQDQCATGATAFHIVDFTAQDVGPQAELTFGMTFAPTEARAYEERILVFVEDDPVAEYVVPLTGRGDNILLSGGGCGVAPGAPGRGGQGTGALALLALVGLALVARRRSATVVLLVAGMATQVHAQATGFDLGVFRPTGAAPTGFITVERPAVTAAGNLAFGTFVNYAKNPLVARSETGALMPEAPVSDRVEMTLLASYGLADRVELTLALPFLQQSGSGGDIGLPVGEGMSLGDVSLAGRVRLVNAGKLSLGASASLTLPTGDNTQYAGTESVNVHARAIVGFDAGALRLAGNVGFRLRGGRASLGPVEQENEVTFGLGAGLRLTKGLDVMGELYGNQGLVDSSASVSPMEVIGGLRWWPAKALAVTGGAGFGLRNGIGAADMRVFVGLAWSPRSETVPAVFTGAPPVVLHDEDGDGIPDAEDECPGEKEDVDGVKDGDGCIDDNDGDGVADAADKCPKEAEDVDNFKDDDGCLDKDNDEDGVADTADKCPDSQEDEDGYQDLDGCDDPDNDGDGIADIVDACTLKPENINGNNDQDGCPDEGEGLVMILDNKMELLAPVLFVRDTAELKKESANVLGQLAATLAAMPAIKLVRLESHTKVRVNANHDYKLSNERGEAVKKFLVDRGVDAKRLEVKPMGSAKPVNAKKPDENDRLEVIILDADKPK